MTDGKEERREKIRQNGYRKTGGGKERLPEEKKKD
jgi:hypothetical protein